MSVRMFLSCIPPQTNHHAKRIVRIGKFSRLADKPELVAAKELLDTLLLPHQPTSPLVPPYRLSLALTWPWLGRHGKRIRALGRIPHMSKPDCDNCSKSITDRLVRLRFIEDDKAVVELHVRKWWGDSPGIQIEIDSLSERRDTADAQAKESRLSPDSEGCAAQADVHDADRFDLRAPRPFA